MTNKNQSPVECFYCFESPIEVNIKDFKSKLEALIGQ
jgi:hypothetical protein